jgi:pilus assembly protein CpaC
LRAKAGVTIVSCSALALAMFAWQAARAQSAPATPGEGTPAQAAPAAPPPAAETTYEDSTNELSVTVGKSVLVDCAQPIQRVAIGLGDIAEATAISPTEIMVDGKAAGETSLIIWDIHGGRQFFNVTVRALATVTGDSLDAIRRELRAELPGQAIRVSYSNNSIFLRGTVNDLVSSSRALQIASSAGKVVNLLDVTVPKADPQILIKVRFASVDRNRARQLGINLFNLGLGNAVGGVTTSQFSPPTITSGSGGSGGGSATGVGGTATFTNEFNLLAFFPGLGVGADISALETKGVVQVLAEPNVMATNGKEASFLAGGEFPYPVVQGSTGAATVTIEFKEYGIRINFIPTITPRGTIHLQVAPEVSALDYTNEAIISGFEVPGITTRRVNTEVELADGESFMIGGLLDKTTNDSFQKIPFIGDIPIIGKLFQSELRTKNDTELIVILTPEIVSPFPVDAKLPSPNFPVPFMPPNSNITMHQPDAKTPENTLPPAPASMPVETLVDSMKPEKPLVIETGNGGFGTGGAAINTGGSGGGYTGGAAAPQQ